MQHIARLALLMLLLPLGASAEDWKPVATDHGVKLEAQTVGNIARLRFTNTGKSAAQANWKVEAALASKQKIENQGELKLDGGETAVIAVGPYHDARGPVAVQGIQGRLTATPAAP